MILLYVCSGHLVCRDLTSYLLSIPCARSSSSVESSRRDNVTEPLNDPDAVMLVTAMTLMKLQICYFGNMALRSSLSLAVMGSLLLTAIPVIIRKDG